MTFSGSKTFLTGFLRAAVSRRTILRAPPPFFFAQNVTPHENSRREAFAHGPSSSFKIEKGAVARTPDIFYFFFFAVLCVFELDLLGLFGVLDSILESL